MREMTAKEKLPSHDRVWEIDALRGFLILSVLCYHLYMTVDAFCINGHYNMDSAAYVGITDPLNFWFTPNGNGGFGPAAFPRFAIKYMQPLWVDVFFVVSGISCGFSRSNLSRGLKILVGAFAVSAFTKLLAVWTGDPAQFIRFGVLHCYAYCHLIYHFLLEKRKSRTLLLVCIPVFLVGYYLRYNPVYSPSALLYPFGIHETDAIGRDYWPIFPMLGWMLIGVVLGRRFYSEKKTRWNSGLMMKITRPLQWMGKHSGPIYLIHIFAYTAVFCGVGYLFGLL